MKLCSRKSEIQFCYKTKLHFIESQFSNLHFASTPILKLKWNSNSILNSILNGAQPWFVRAVNCLIHSSGQHRPAEHEWRTTEACYGEQTGKEDLLRPPKLMGYHPHKHRQAHSHLHKLNGADCTLLINWCKQTWRLLRPSHLSRQPGDRGVGKRLWSFLYAHISISLPSCLFLVDTHTMEKGEVSKENDMQAGTGSVRKCHCRLGVSRCFQLRKVGG